MKLIVPQKHDLQLKDGGLVHAAVLLLTPMENKDDIIIGGLYDFVTQHEITLEDPAYPVLKNEVHMILDERRQLGCLMRSTKS